MWGKRRWHNEYAPLGPANKFVSDAGEFSGSRGAAPVGWKVIRNDALLRQIAWDLGSNQNQILRCVVGVEVDKVFQHRQRLMLGGVS